ncbi:MAG: gfo/Idh/MocA family oxidoreductase [Candidatus Nanohalarchaeota archaeon]|nr:MAG: gfo/Idh/MocA family oxidoreductase [Candidatus Nanohaloarchaeota archaeon]
MIKVGVIGVGAMGKNHVRIYSKFDNVNLVAVADSDKSNLDKINGCNKYTEYKDMLKQEKLDIVSVVVPTKLHKKIAIDVMRNNISVLIEKPIASTLKEAQYIIDCACKMNVKLTIGHIERFNPALLELKKRISDAGRIIKIEAHRVGPFPPRVRDVGVILDLSVHDIDIMRWLLDSEIERIYSESERNIHTTHEDLFDAIIRFKNGTVGTLNINWLTPTKVRKLHVLGEKGLFIVDYLSQDLYFYENNEIKKDFNYADLVKGVSEGNMIKYKVDKIEPLESELKSFIHCVSDGSKPSVSGEDGKKALFYAQKIAESARKKKVLSL